MKNRNQGAFILGALLFGLVILANLLLTLIDWIL